MIGETVECPHCAATTALFDPQVVPVPPAPPQFRQASGGGTNPAATVAEQIIENIERVVVGKRHQIMLTLVAFFSEGHALLEDVPGVAKTMLARALAQSVGGKFKRTQCTPDLLPNDITGASIFNPKTTEFEFRPGPLFAQIVLADEINRATPRAQAALLEAMAERQVSVDGIVHKLERPFFIIATQNPVDHEGTFPLPEAQLDRFIIRLSLGYPTPQEESAMIERLQLGHPIESLSPVVSVEDIISAQDSVRQVQVHERVRDYIVQLVCQTREHEAIVLGASPRCTLALTRAAQAYAAINGANHVMPDDVKVIAPAVLPHRLIVRPESRLRRINSADIVTEILRSVKVPVMPDNLG
jgi:MoxR-like ATPase